MLCFGTLLSLQLGQILFYVTLSKIEVFPRGGYKSRRDFLPLYNLIPGSTGGAHLSHQLAFHQLREAHLSLSTYNTWVGSPPLKGISAHLSKASDYVLKRGAHLSKVSTYLLKHNGHTGHYLTASCIVKKMLSWIKLFFVISSFLWPLKYTITEIYCPNKKCAVQNAWHSQKGGNLQRWIASKIHDVTSIYNRECSVLW